MRTMSTEAHRVLEQELVIRFTACIVIIILEADTAELAVVIFNHCSVNIRTMPLRIQTSTIKRGRCI